MTVPHSPPGDLELMLYADGELDGERLAEVEAWLAADADAARRQAPRAGPSPPWCAIAPPPPGRRPTASPTWS